jgi:hypothetical protein
MRSTNEQKKYWNSRAWGATEHKLLFNHIYINIRLNNIW